MTKESDEHGSDSRRKSRGRSRDDAVFPVPAGRNLLPADYVDLLRDVKERIRSARLRVTVAANAAMILLYWDIGKIILNRQEKEGWGAKVIDRLSHDLKVVFPDMTGFSPRNLKYMRTFAGSWPDREFVQRTIAQIPWRSNIALLDKLKDPEIRMWYAQKTIEHGWSRDVLDLRIANRLHERQGRALNNFEQALPPADSDMAAQVFKDPYLFDFLGTADPRKEREVERALVDHVQHFLLEMGTGFAFVGRQVLLEVGNRDYSLHADHRRGILFSVPRMRIVAVQRRVR